eukprot:scaffold193829_cov46-Prasinocladus_malaysianus.AAC.1
MAEVRREEDHGVLQPVHAGAERGQEAVRSDPAPPTPDATPAAVRGYGHLGDDPHQEAGQDIQRL